MKIKLQDYSLISNEWIEARIKHFQDMKNAIIDSKIANPNRYDSIIEELVILKQQLIPSEKLADVEDKQGFPLYTNFGTKQDFLTSEIEIQ